MADLMDILKQFNQNKTEKEVDIHYIKEILIILVSL